MAKVMVGIKVMVTLDVPDELAAKVSADDLVNMARAACPDSSVTPGPPSGVQVEVDGVAQEDDRQHPIFADVYLEHDQMEDPEYEFEDDFARAEREYHRR